ncbi:hypothetical protein F4808DRAFT_413467 [Astrocystis sublimbata]|nr:hypothetical protein F4808DRAFT_413467 [Astrocystis sublimbata]
MLLTHTYCLHLLYFCASAVGATVPSRQFPSRTIFQFNESGTWLENIAVRANGDLLATMLSPSASLYTLKKPYAAEPEFSLIHTFDNATGLLGIVEISSDDFAVLSTQLSTAGAPVPGSTAIWRVSFKQNQVNTRRIVSIPDVLVPNGITSIPGSSAVLVADSIRGTITRCDTRTETCRTILKRNETSAVPGSSNPIGINGLHYRDGHIYWSNSDLVSLYSIPADKKGYPISKAKVETVGKINASFIDDFAEDHAGNFFIAAGPNNTIVELHKDGSTRVVAGSQNEFTVAGCTAAAFGRTSHDMRVLYVVTNGGSMAPINGKVEPAKIAALDASGCI